MGCHSDCAKRKLNETFICVSLMAEGVEDFCMVIGNIIRGGSIILFIITFIDLLSYFGCLYFISFTVFKFYVLWR